MMKSLRNLVASTQPARRLDRRCGSRAAHLGAFVLAVGLALGCSKASPSISTSPAPAPGSATSPDDPSGVFHGRTIAQPMGYGGADWLERSDRATTEEPERVLDALGITPDMQVADVGAGIGYFSLRIAKRLGPKGRVFATDIQPEMLARLQANAADAGMTDITPVLCTDRDAGLAPASVDLELMVDVYHELAHPAETLAQLRAALKPGGRMVLVEYRGDDPNVGIKPEHTMTVDQVKREIEPAGFRLLRLHDFLPKQRIFEFQATAS